MAALERTRELTKRICTFRIVLGTLILGGACVSCDHILQLPAIVSNYYYRAGVDSCAHGLVGLLSWAVVTGALPPQNCWQLGAILLCGVLSSVLDVDHFVAARSIYLRDALVLPFRPSLHSSTLIIFIFVFLLFAVHVTASQRLRSLPYMFLTASLSHQIRDASRRGLWFWPLWSTPPLPYWVYIALVCILPIIVRLVMERIVDPLPSKSSNVGAVEQSDV